MQEIEPLWEWDPFREEIDGCKLIRTCGACPEQYEVFLDGSLIGDLRLRHGYFSARYPDFMGDIVYGSNPKGDGVFYPEERDQYLQAAVAALKCTHENKRTA